MFDQRWHKKNDWQEKKIKSNCFLNSSILIMIIIIIMNNNNNNNNDNNNNNHRLRLRIYILEERVS